MNYTLSAILSIFNNPHITIESKYTQINNELSQVKLLSVHYQQEFYKDLTQYVIDNPLFSIVLTIHYPLLADTPIEDIIKHYMNEYNKIYFSQYYILDPVITNYGGEYVLDWSAGINVHYFNHTTDPHVLKYAYILENIIKYINLITKNSKYGEYLYNNDNQLGLIEILIENGSIFKYTERFMLNIYTEHNPTIEVIMTEVIGGIVGGLTIDDVITANYDFFLNSLYQISCIEYELSCLNGSYQFQNIKTILVFILANLLSSIVLEYKFYLGMDHNFLLYISTLKYF